MLLDPKRLRMAAVISNAVMTKAILIAGGYFLGVYLDKKFHTEPYFMMGLIVLAMVIGIWWIVRLGNRMKL